MNKSTELVSLAQKLIQLPSESSNPVKTNTESPEHEISAHLANICHAAGIKYELQEALTNRHNLIMRFPSPGRPKLLLTAHMDTVSAAKVESPFAGEIKGGKIIGRGSCDDKGPLAAAFCALLDLHNEKTNLAFDITLAATVDEECSMSGSRKLAEIIGNFDLCIGLEPTSLKIIKAHKGVYRCKISTQGTAAHSSAPEKGKNAIIDMYDIMTDLQMLEFRLRRHPDKELGRASLAITQIQGGSSINIIPDHCDISVDIRLLPHQSPAEMAQQVRDIVAARGKVEDIFQAAGIKTEMENEHIQRFQQTLKDNGHNQPASVAAYATDCAQLNHLGPCIIWGPGSIAQAHQADEFIAIKELESAYEIIKSFVTG
jgi:acetylornithine deacetylase